MAVETAKDKIKLNQIMGQKQEIITIDGDVIVNDIKPDVLKVINTNGILCIYKKEVLNGKVKLEGCINTYIIYLADDENSSIRTINTSLDFAEFIDMENCTEGMTLDETLCIKGFETKVLNGRKLHVKAFVDTNIKVCSNNEVEVITDINNSEDELQMLNCNKNVMSLIGENSSKTVLKDTIDLKTEDELAEIMKVDFSLSDMETKTSYNKILIKANANVRIMYLTEDNRISEADSQIPLMGFIDMPNVSDTSECMAKTKLKNLIIKPNNTEEHSLYIEADIELFCRAYERKEMNMIEDMYSISNNVDLKKNMVRAATEQFDVRENFEVKEKLTNPELLYGRILGMSIRPVVEETEIRNGRIKYTGKLEGEIMVSSENNVNAVNIEIPFDFEVLNNRIKENSDVDTEINVISQKLTNTDDGLIIEVDLQANLNIQNDEEIEFAQDITMEEYDNQDIYSMVIYFVKPGDTLWKIAKKFRSRVEDIARVNGIEDVNKIYPGQQLYIPKFTRSRIAI